MNCPRCGSAIYYRLKTRFIFRCKECRHDYSTTSSTMLCGYKMPLEKYDRAFEAFRIGLTIKAVAALIECNQRTAWRLRKIFLKSSLIKKGTSHD